MYDSQPLSPRPLNRRRFLAGTALGAAGLLAGACGPLRSVVRGREPNRLFFVSAGKTCVIRSDGTGFKALEFDVPNQATWQPAGFFPDGRRVLFLSMEPRRDGPGRPFDEYYTQTPTHIWSYDLDSGSLVELCTRERMAVFETPALLVGSDRILVQVVKNKVGQIWNMNLDGTDAREFTRANEGFPYGLSLSPDGRRVAFHTAGPSPHSYRIWTSDVDGGNRVLVAGHPDHLYFGPMWSPDGQWLAWVDCRHKSDPGHDWADVCVGRPDGRDVRTLTEGQVHWFGATYGGPTQRAGGSNMMAWTHEGRLLFSRKLPGTKVPWEYQANRPDTDHFNRDWKPEASSGGTEICRLDPVSGLVSALTRNQPPRWDLRASESADGREVVFLRCATGELPSLWVMRPDGTRQRMISTGIDGKGADHPRWVPTKA